MYNVLDTLRFRSLYYQYDMERLEHFAPADIRNTIMLSKADVGYK
jgi:hypothetical protein